MVELRTKLLARCYENMQSRWLESTQSERNTRVATRTARGNEVSDAFGRLKVSLL